MILISEFGFYPYAFAGLKYWVTDVHIPVYMIEVTNSTLVSEMTNPNDTITIELTPGSYF
jgi:hypothetical protein